MRSRQLVAFFAVAALLFAMTVYGSHFHRGDSKANESTHCDLCIQFGSAGGPSAPPTLIVRVSLVVVAVPYRYSSQEPTKSDQEPRGSLGNQKP